MKNMSNMFSLLFNNLVLCAFGLFFLTNVSCEKDSTSEPQDNIDDLLGLVQETTFNYFWDFADISNGLAKERSQSLVLTSGGTGFGLSSFPIAVERGWKSKAEVLNRLDKVLTFLEQADTYHGAFSHWYFRTGKTKPFSEIDNGGDIVETAFLIQGLLINRNYFSEDTEEEKAIRDRITTIWEVVEWDWYTQGKKSITWHWSKTDGFAINQTVSGWNEALMVYVLAAASPTHTIDKLTYTNGWARNGSMKNGQTFYGHQLPLGEDLGGPLFFAHYSFIGLDPRGLADEYISDYFEQNKNHSLINYEYCKANPKDFEGYGENCWGLTASDNNNGYSAHSPNNDLGVITPTAALSSFPYTPEESTKALEYFYERKDELWGEYGFYDAFSDENNWVADGYLAIDQGPIVAMIENYRTQLLWTIFMMDQDVQKGLQKLGFSSPHM